MSLVYRMPNYISFERKTKADKKVYINLNIYRNLHYRESNLLKIRYKELAWKELESDEDVFQSLIGTLYRLRLTFTLVHDDKRKRDRSNALCIHEKFFCDALVECGILMDDTDDYIESTHYYSRPLKDSEGTETFIEIRLEVILQ